MAAPQSNVDVCNLACDYLGVPPITSVDAPTTETELIMARHYDDARRWVLRRGVWGFAKARAALTRDPIAPLFDYADRYKAPGDFIRLLQPAEMGDVDLALFWFGPHEFSQGYLMANAGGAAQLNVRYIQDVTDIKSWDTDFPSLVATRLAYKTCIVLTNDRELAKILKQESELSQVDALVTNGQENKPQRIQRSRALDARRGLGRWGRSILGGTWTSWGGPS